MDKERWLREGLSRWMIFASANGLLTIYLLEHKNQLLFEASDLMTISGCFKIALAISILT